MSSSSRGVEFEFRHLGNDVFNEVGWFDPSGQLVRLVEARTFSPSKRLATDTSRCGYFLEIALPSPDRETAKAYWEEFGFVGMDEVGRLAAAYLLHQRFHRSRSVSSRRISGAPPCGSKSTMSAAPWRRLAEVGIVPNGELPPALRSVPAAVFAAPEGTPILLTS